MSFNNKIDSNATYIIKGMHKQHDNWANNLEKRSGTKSGLITNIQLKQQSAEDKEKYSAKLKPIPYQSYYVRISRPDLIYSANVTAEGKATIERRTILPQPIYVTPTSYLESNTTAGTQEDLSKSYRDLTTLLSTPSGLVLKDSVLPYPFPAALKVLGLSPISDALIGQQLQYGATLEGKVAP